MPKSPFQKKTGRNAERSKFNHSAVLNYKSNCKLMPLRPVGPQLKVDHSDRKHPEKVLRPNLHKIYRPTLPSLIVKKNSMKQKLSSTKSRTSRRMIK
jgi:hypothetical protein